MAECFRLLGLRKATVFERRIQPLPVSPAENQRTCSHDAAVFQQRKRYGDLSDADKQAAEIGDQHAIFGKIQNLPKKFNQFLSFLARQLTTEHEIL